eukprot:m.154938 g.154938  ORF g.154938 m.154938 type:complete len:137 (-) comp17514_c0_seq2:116-526(-)
MGGCRCGNKHRNRHNPAARPYPVVGVSTLYPWQQQQTTLQVCNLNRGKTTDCREFSHARNMLLLGSCDGLKVDVPNDVVWATAPGGVHALERQTGNRIGILGTGVKTGNIAIGQRDDTRVLFIAADSHIKAIDLAN